jgi:lipopolysaccharide assembly outer membrane protein LptD (OstA)
MTLIKLLLLAYALLLSQNTSGGGKLIVEHADRHIGQRVQGEQLRILEGNVHIRQDTLNMFCDQAIFYENREKLEFRGNVLIDNGHRQLTAQTIYYYPERKWADCYGNVVIRGASDSLFSNQFSYDFGTEHATAVGDVYLSDFENNIEIWGQYGSYKALENRSFVRTNARLVRVDSSSQDSFIVTANRLIYEEDSIKTATALDSVVILQGELRATCD